MPIQSMQDLMLHELQDIYDAEHQITAALPLMAEAVTDTNLRRAFQEHLGQTEAQIERLNRVFEILGQQPKRVQCKGMKGIIAEGQEKIEEEGMDSQVRNAALLSAAQHVEHYEMASYGTLRTVAYQMGQNEIAELLQQTLDEEEQTDKKLSQIANTINQKAM